MRYAVVKSMLREDLKPFGGCYPVIKETAAFVTVLVNRIGEDKQEKYSKGNIHFFTDQDISERLQAANLSVSLSWQQHEKFVKSIIQDLKKEHTDG